MLENVDINLVPRFSICPVALDMPDGSICRLRDEIYIISSFEQSEKHIDFAEQKYRAIEDCISTKCLASNLYTNSIIGFDLKLTLM